LYLTITLTQMLASFTPTVTLVLLYVTGVEIPTTRATVCVCLIGLGCAIASYGEGQLSLIGMAFRSAGIVAEATRLVLLQRLLKNLKLGVLESQCADCV
jgi:drug/metabolite transporter (DMT)-like permease